MTWAKSLQVEHTSKLVTVQTHTASSLEEVEVLVKSAIWSSCSPGRLIAINVNRGKSTGYEVKWKFETLGEENDEEVVNCSIEQREIGVENYKSEKTKPIYQNLSNLVPVEVLEASHTYISFPTVIKLYHCEFSNISNVIQETIMQVRLASAYSCKLLDIFIRKGSKRLLEVGLVMEKLEGNLETDIELRVLQDNTYTELELRHILECIAEALLYAKLRVSSI